MKNTLRRSMLGIVLGSLLSLALPASADWAWWAWEPKPEEIEIDGETFLMDTFPLDALPDGSRFLRDPAQEFVCVGRERGYAGRWAIREQGLYLTDVRTSPCIEGRDRLEAGEIIPGTTYPVAATWYSGTLRVRLDVQPGMRAASVERWREITVVEGKIVAARETGRLRP